MAARTQKRWAILGCFAFDVPLMSGSRDLAGNLRSQKPPLTTHNGFFRPIHTIINLMNRYVKHIVALKVDILKSDLIKDRKGLLSDMCGQYY